MKTGPTNISTLELVRELYKQKTKDKTRIWKRVADDLMKSSRQRREVNIERINRTTKEGETIIVPGKVLGNGELTHKVNVAALSFSESAALKINSAGGKLMNIRELMKAGIKGKRVRIIG